MSRLAGRHIRWGSYVRLKSGGALMLVVEPVDKDGMITCEWKADRDIHVTVLPALCVETVRYPSAREPWRTE